ncbi:hypothetical protein VTO42DRAFT_3849 [Malbranchea cinnamomea]
MSVNQPSLAASAVKNQGLSQQRASILYNVPQSSLSNYIARRTTKNAVDLKKQKLLVSEEAALVRWILSMDNRGLPALPSTVRSMADFLKKRGEGISETVGKNWTSSFVKRHPELKSRFVRKFSYKRISFTPVVRSLCTQVDKACTSTWCLGLIACMCVSLCEPCRYAI